MISRKWWKLLAVVALSGVLVACGDDDGTGAPDAGGGDDAGRDASAPAEDAGGDDGGAADAGSDAGANDAGSDAGDPDSGTPVAAEPRLIPFSMAGNDRLFGVAHDPEGNIYVTGQISSSASTSGDFSLLVAKFDATGQLVIAFGDAGIVRRNLAVGGGNRELGRGIVYQPSTGHIVVAADFEHDPTIDPNGPDALLRGDTDIAVLRFDAETGEFDDSFGEEGLAVINPNNGVVVTTVVNGMTRESLTGGDTHWSLSLAANDGLVLHGATRAQGTVEGGGARTDNDWLLVRLTADGDFDTTFSTDGFFTLDFGGPAARLSARSATVLANGSIVGTGYMTSTTLGETSQQPVLYKVLASGELDPSFGASDERNGSGMAGVWHGFAGAGMRNAEAYGAAPQGDSFVTIGYGPTPSVPRAPSGVPTDWVSFRFSGTGVFDTTYGTDGASYIDVGGQSDNGRSVVVLPDGRVVAVGGGRPTVTPPATLEQDAMVVILGMNGAPDTGFAPNGYRTYDFVQDDFFHGIAAAPDGDSVAIVGVAGAATPNTDDDDSVLFILPVE